MPQENWNERDLELEREKTAALAKVSIGTIMFEALLDFLGISAIKDYLKNQHKEWYDHLIALLVAGAYLEALWLFGKFLFTLVTTRKYALAIAAVIGEEGFKKFLLKIGRSWLLWLLVIDLLLVLYDAITKYLSQNAQLEEDLWHLYVLYWDAPHRDEIFRLNIGGLPKKPTPR